MIDCSDYLMINQSRPLYLAMKFILCAQLMIYIVTHNKIHWERKDSVHEKAG